MANFPIPTDPTYDAGSIAMLTNATPASGPNTFNPLISRLLENTHFVKLLADTLSGNVLTLESKIAALTGFVTSGASDTYAELPDPSTLPPGTKFVVRSDENHGDLLAIYEVALDGTWMFVTTMDVDITGLEVLIDDLRNELIEQKDVFDEFADEIRTSQSNLEQTIERRNIIHNWDFRGANPNPLLNTVVNQRGQVEYVGTNIFCIDRWSHRGAARRSTIEDGFIRLHGTTTASQGVALEQTVEFPQLYAGKTVTMSTMTRSTQPFEFGLCINNVYTRVGTSVNHEEFEIVSATITLPNVLTNLRVVVGSAIGIVQELQLDFASVKLEVGSISTLANDTPMEYGTELARCQRYQYNPLLIRQSFAHIGMGVARSTTECLVLLPLPSVLRVFPAVAHQENLRLALNGGPSGILVSSIGSAGASGGTLFCVCTASGLAVGATYALWAADLPAQLLFDANL